MPYRFRDGIRPYPLNFLDENYGGDLSQLVLGDTNRPPGTNWFVFCMSDDQALKLTTALIEGTIVTYGAEFVHDVMFPWLQAREFPNDFPEGCPVSICDLILECIENDQTLIDAIINIVNEDSTSEYPGGEGSVPEQQRRLDCVYGAALKVADYVIDELISLYDNIEAGIEALQATVVKWPSLPGIDVQTVVAFIGGVAIPARRALVDDADFRRDLACRLYCIMSQFQDTLDIIIPEAISLWADGEKFSNPDVFGAILGEGVGWLAQFGSLATDECDNDWQLCSCVDRVQIILDSDGTPVDVPHAGKNRMVVSWSGTVEVNVVSDIESDGVFIPPYTGSYAPGVSWRQLGGGFPETPAPNAGKSSAGYTYVLPEIDTTKGNVRFRFLDSNYIDNQGDFILQITRWNVP